MKKDAGRRLIADLQTLADVIASLSADQYGIVQIGFPSSVGSQVRHCLDHLSAFVDGLETGRIDYEARRRGSPVESDRTAALVMVAMMIERIETRLDPEHLHRTVIVEDRLDPLAQTTRMVSSVHRELAFVMSHTTHHMALVDLMVRSFGVATPARLGYGASTLAWLHSITGSA